MVLSAGEDRDEKKEGMKEMSAESTNFCIIFVNLPAIAQVKNYLQKCNVSV